MKTTNNLNRFSFWYTTRVHVTKEDTTIVNLSLVFVVLSTRLAPWVAAFGFVAALALGYRFSINKKDPHFSADLDEVVRDAAKNIKDTFGNSAEA